MACPLVNSLGLLVSHWAAISLKASYWSDIYEIEISSILDKLVHGLFTDLEYLFLIILFLSSDESSPSVSHWAAISLEASYWSDLHEIELSSILDELVHGSFTDLESLSS